MTINVTTSRIGYAGDNVSTVFNVPFLFFANGDLTVTKTSAAGAIATLVLNVDYTLTGAGVTSGGTLTKTTVLLTGETLQIILAPAITQLAHYVQNQPFPSATVEQGFDKLTQISQRLQDEIGRALRAPDGDSSPLLILPSAAVRANTFPTFDSSGNLSVATTLPGGTLSAAAIGALLYPQTAAEAAASVTPTNYAYPPGNVWRYGAKGDGATDDSAAFANAALVSGTHPMQIWKTASFYKIGTPFQLPAGGTVYGYGNPLLKAVTAGQILCYAVNQPTITIAGVYFQGVDSSTPPLTIAALQAFYSPNNNALASITNCTDVRITDCGFSTFPNGVAAQGCTRLWIMRNFVTHFGAQTTGVGSGVSNAGILSGSAIEFVIDDNTVDGCDMPAGAVFFPSYGISFTGASTQKGNSISNNRVWNIPSWDALGSHDIFGCMICNNDIRNVRKGIDIGHLQVSNLVRSLVCANNYIEATTVDMWQGASVDTGGIEFVGFSATGPIGVARITNTGAAYVNGTYNNVPLTGGSGTTAQATIVVSGGKCVSLTITAAGVNYAITDVLSASNANLGGAGAGLLIAITPSTLCDGCSITGNVIRGFFNLTNGVAGGVPSSITIFQAAHCTVTGNTVIDVGSLQTNGTGVYMQGTLAQISINGNSFHGDMGSGVIRLASATIDTLSVTGNSANQVTAANGFFVSTGSTVTNLALANNANNCGASALQQSTSTLTYSGSDLTGSNSWTPGSVASAASVSTNVTVTGAIIGDFVQTSINASLLGCTLTGYASAAGVVTCVIANLTGGAQNINGGAAVTVLVRNRRQFA